MDKKLAWALVSGVRSPCTICLTVVRGPPFVFLEPMVLGAVQRTKRQPLPPGVYSLSNAGYVNGSGQMLVLANLLCSSDVSLLAKSGFLCAKNIMGGKILR